MPVGIECYAHLPSDNIVLEVVLTGVVTITVLEVLATAIGILVVVGIVVVVVVVVVGVVVVAGVVGFVVVVVAVAVGVVAVNREPIKTSRISYFG